MFKKGDKIKLTYYEFDQQVESHGWVVEDYDNGLLKVRESTSPHEKAKALAKKLGIESTQELEQKRKVIVFNMRSIGFLAAQLIE